MTFHYTDEMNMEVKIAELKETITIAIYHLDAVCNHADEDCPSEYRTKHFNPSIQDARAFIDEVTKEDSDDEVN
tara:strand:+ start:446 stop:667 length:222 start_codon:yes stop_codon:yes gene_type:complete